MALLSVQNLGKYFGERCLFHGVSFELGPHDSLGLVGCNGCGKTTLFRLLTGEETADEGQAVFSRDAKIGYLAQHVGQGDTRTLWDTVEDVFAPLKALEKELVAINNRLSVDGTGDVELIARQHELRERFEADGGLYYLGRVRATLLGLGFSEEEFSLPMRALSGGQRSKAAMARLLLSDANLLLLDEPTNHLDIAATEWLEEFLRGYRGAVLVISHDRYFLDRVTRRTLELSGGTPYLTEGRYSVHREKREKDREIARHHYKTAQREIRHLEESIETLQRFNREKSIRAAESKEKLLERKKAALEIPEEEEKGLSFDFSVAETGGNEVLTAGELCMKFGEKTLFSHVGLSLFRGDRVFLLGPNGCGKTTLLRLLTGTLSPTEGYIRTGAKISVGYYDQTQAGLNETGTVMEEVWHAYPKLTQTQVRSALAAFLFRGDSVFAKVSTLSGGERARVLLLKLMLARHNLLLLDEPTNHLDIPSREALEDALLHYNGTALVVSHDRYFINRLASRVVRLTAAGCETFDGNYDTYLQRLHTAEATPAETTRPVRENTYQKRKEQDATRRRLKTRITRLEEQIEANEAALASLRDQLEDPAVAADYEQVTQLAGELSDRETALDTALQEWETLQTEWEDFV